MIVLIKEIGKKYGYKMKELSEKMNVSQMALSFWQTGKRDVGISKLKDIANAIGCEIHELIGTGDKYAHFYDDKTGEWLGIRKK